MLSSSDLSSLFLVVEDFSLKLYNIKFIIEVPLQFDLTYRRRKSHCSLILNNIIDMKFNINSYVMVITHWTADAFELLTPCNPVKE